MGKVKQKFNLEVSYPADRYFDRDYDLEIFDAASITNKEDVGSGMGFGSRDLSFEFDSRRRRNSVIRTLKKKFRGLKMSYTEYV